MEYYHNLVIEKSWEELQNLRRQLDFVLIGGWAVYLYTKSLKSKDIDIIVDFDALPTLRKNYNLYKNERLSKYEAVREEVQIDIYLPHFSRIGIPVEDLLKNVKELEGFRVLNKDYLLALKIYTLSQRARTPKGAKDFIDVVSLMYVSKADISEAKKVLAKYKISRALKTLAEISREVFEIPELNLNKHQFSKLRKSFLV